MAAVEAPLTIEQGVSWSHGWRVRYSATGDPADLAPIDDTWTAAAQVRKQASPTSPLLYTFAVSVDDTGAVVLGVPYGDSEDWMWDYGHYDVEVTNADASVRLRVARGPVRVSREVTTSV